jgi:hypothetical protein
MNDDHILDILDKQRFDELSKAEKSLIESHTVECSNCSVAFKAAQISSVLLKTSVLQNFEPSPFFTKRILANLPENKIIRTPFFAITRLWRASGSLVALMITTVLVLIITTVFAPTGKVSAGETDSAEIVILDGKMSNRDINNEQLFQEIYGVENNKEK